MPLADVVRPAVSTLMRHQLWRALTMLGICIGVGVSICGVAVGEGASPEIDEQIQSLGDNLIWIEAGSRKANGVRTGIRGTKSLLLSDAKAIQEQVPWS